MVYIITKYSRIPTEIKKIKFWNIFVPKILENDLKCILNVFHTSISLQELLKAIWWQPLDLGAPIPLAGAYAPPRSQVTTHTSHPLHKTLPRDHDVHLRPSAILYTLARVP